KKTAARERLPEMVMRCQTSVPLPGAKPVIAPSRGYSNHQFTGGYDFWRKPTDFVLVFIFLPSFSLILALYSVVGYTDIKEVAAFRHCKRGFNYAENKNYMHHRSGL
ncbi:MAG: hypothetical protein IJO76_04245, partial [Clostridia bacterium]|nr:hypothetical protein [Clostridia bacterium]